MKYTWILLLLFSCHTKTNQVESTADTASKKEVATTNELPDSTTIPALTPDIAGTYMMDESRDCNLQISIIKTGNDYTYNLKTGKRNATGNLSLSKGEGTEEVYINLLGLPPLADEAGNKKEKATASEDQQNQTLEMLYSDGALDIQNSGNAMNSYEKLAECGDKFIHLVKKK